MHLHFPLFNRASPTRPLFPRHFFLKLLILALIILGAQSAPAATWQADFTIRVSSSRTQTIFFKGRLFQKDLKVRIEPADSEEVNLFDFKAGIGIRIFPKDRIYFTKPISRAKMLKAAKEAWISAPLPYQEKRTLLWTGSIKGKAARLYLITLALNNHKSHQLRWVSDDQHEAPLRIIYPGPANETVIIDYEPILTEEFPINHFEPPANYLSLNPF